MPLVGMRTGGVVLAVLATALPVSCFDAVPDLPPPPADASFPDITPAPDAPPGPDAPPTPDASSVDAADAEAGLGPLCDLVPVLPDAGPDAATLDAGDAAVTYVVKCSVPVTQIASGVPFSDTGADCALASNGDLYCWGSPREGATGIGPADAAGFVATPTKVLGSVKMVSTSSFTTCAVKTDGTVYCWGIDNLGQLGVDPAKADHCADACFASPKQVTQAATTDGGVGAALPPMDKVAAGEWLTCAIATGSGDLWCWGGMNAYGPSGWQPGKVTGIPTPVKDVSVGDGSSALCAVGADGSAWCWGDPTWGKLGYTPDAGGFILTPGKIALDVTGAAFGAVKRVSVGYDSACALKVDGTVWCWGSNSNAQLGQGTFDSSNHAAPVQVKGLPPNIAALNAQAGYAVTAVTASGDVLSWGWMSNFSFGDGVQPIQVCPGAHLCLTAPRRVDTFPKMIDVQHLLGVASDGTVWAWGDNTRGYLGHTPGTHGDSFCNGASGTPCDPVAHKVPVYP